MNKVTDQDYKKWAREIASQGAVVFFGAGFSAGAIGFDGELPLGNQLRDKLGEFCGFERKYYETKDLKDVAEYCLLEKSRQEIVEKLKDIFAVKQPKDEQKVVVGWPWKSIYTTNYDDLISCAGKQVGKNIDVLTLESMLPSESRNFCLHINGCVDRLEPKHLDNSFKLSRSSYVNSDVFANSSKWKDKFMDDLQYSALVVFIGYSLADMPIERILLAKTESMRKKTIFVVADPKNYDDDPIGNKKFERYGKLLRIGVESFANKIRECWPQDTNLGFNYLEKIIISSSLDANIRDNDLKLFFEQGKFKDGWLQNEVLQYLKNGHQIRKSFLGKEFTLGDKITEGVKNKYSLKSPIQSDYVPKLIPRKEEIGEAQRELALDSVGILGVFGELGSGKTIFLRQLAIALVESGNSVYFVRHGDFISQKEEIDTLLKRLKDGNEKAIIFIDSYLNQLKISQYIAKKVKETRCVKLILATRAVDWHGDEGCKSISEDSSVEIGQLSDLDLVIFTQIISHLGLWSRSLSKRSSNEQKKYLQRNCNAQMLLILLDIFNSEHIYNKLVKSLNNVLSNKQIKKILFVICFLHVVNITSKDIALFSYLLGDDGLGNLKSQHVKQLRALNLWIDNDSSSSILALFILRHMFSYDEITGYAFEILKRVRNAEKSYHNLKYQAYLKLLNYRTMSRVFGKEKDGDKDKKFTFLRNYYDDAKREIPILIENPQFWLQYAICHISIGKFKEAQDYLDQAYGKANQKDSYDVDYIDNQQARLYIYQGIETEDKEDAFSFFKKAVELLGGRRKEDEYKYSIIESFWEFLEKHFLLFEKNKQEVIQKVLADHHEKFCSFCGQGSWYKQKIIRGCEKVFEKYLPNLEKPNLSKNLSSK